MNMKQEKVSTLFRRYRILQHTVSILLNDREQRFLLQSKTWPFGSWEDHWSFKTREDAIQWAREHSRMDAKEI